MAAGHVGGGPGFVDEDEALRIQIALAVEPVLPLLQDVGAVLLDSVASLFLRVAQLFKRDVLALFPDSQDIRAPLLDPP
jgi:hypothetical protein